MAKTTTKKAERHIPKSAVRHELDDVTYHVYLPWGEWEELQEEVKGKDSDEALRIVKEVLAHALVHIDGLEDRDGNAVQYDGNLRLIPSHHMLKLLAAVSSAQIPEEMMGDIPSPTPSTPGPGDSPSASRRERSSSTPS